MSTTTARARRTAQWTVLVALAAGLGLAPTTGAAAASAAVPATGIKLAVTTAGAMIDVKGQLWVSDPSANQVDVFSEAGKLLHQVKTLPGARGLLATPDGSAVEVAESDASAVAEVSTTSYTKTGTWPTDSCPWSLAWVTGLLAYSFGCDPGNDQSGVATLAAPSSTPTEMLSHQYSPPQLAGFGSTLAVSRLELTPGSVITYSVDENGAATPLASVEPDESANVAFSPDGTSLLTAAYSDSGTVAFNPTTGGQQIAYPGMGSATAVAVSPNGRYIATGFSSYNSTVNLVDTTTDTTVWTRLLSLPASIGGSNYAGLAPNTLTFSPGSSEVFGLASFQAVSGVYLFASDLHPAASHVSVKVSQVPAGRKLPVTLTGTPGACVTLTAKSAGARSPHPVATVTLPASGHATLTFAATYSGSLVATDAGDAAHLPATARAAYTVASLSRAHILDGHRHHKVVFYKELNKVRVLLTTSPASDAVYSATPQVERRGHWVSGRTLRGREVNGRGGVYFKSMQNFVKYRVKFTVSSSAASRASHVTSGAFELR